MKWLTEWEISGWRNKQKHVNNLMAIKINEWHKNQIIIKKIKPWSLCQKYSIKFLNQNYFTSILQFCSQIQDVKKLQKPNFGKNHLVLSLHHWIYNLKSENEISSLNKWTFKSS